MIKYYIILENYMIILGIDQGSNSGYGIIRLDEAQIQGYKLVY